ncbi:YveK family protein [Chengkuizengella sp. SCS-71B]|uniref:YveK family protein n=1 Tax=Chengkuizengella sp. SCS-71B TaxID=3115290 RepID=UPI0032C211B8
MEQDMNVKEFLQLILRKMWMIIIITVIVTVTTGLVNYYVLTPTYKSSSQILVTPEISELQPFDLNDIRSSIELINTYSVIIKSPLILEQVSENLEGKYSAQYISSLIQVYTENQSQVFTIEVTSEDREMASQITNTVAQVFKTKIVELMQVNNVTILSEAKVPNSPVKPNPILNIAISFVVAVVFSLVLIFLLEFFDNSVKTERHVDDLELSVLGTVNKIGKINMKKFLKEKRSKKEDSVTKEGSITYEA